MATYKNGVPGNFSGKLGNLVFYSLKGKPVVRSRSKITKPPSEKQLANQMGLRVANAFLKPMMEFIQLGFAAMAEGTGKSAYNLALGYNKKQAIGGVYPDLEMDYAQVLVSQGEMEGAYNPGVELTSGGLEFSWNCPRGLPWPRETDQVMLLAYFPGLGKAVYKLVGPGRSAAAATLAIPANLLEAYMEVYISFVAQNRKELSDSTYLGHFNK